MGNVLLSRDVLNCNDRGIALLCNALYTSYKGELKGYLKSSVIDPLNDKYYNSMCSEFVLERNKPTDEKDLVKFDTTYTLVAVAKIILDECASRDVSLDLVVSLETLIFVLEDVREKGTKKLLSCIRHEG